jgi:hypothetical protein
MEVVAEYDNHDPQTTDDVGSEPYVSDHNTGQNDNSPYPLTKEIIVKGLSELGRSFDGISFVFTKLDISVR